MINTWIQERDVKVIRLIARGTVEEMKYLRQIYKTNLTSETIERQDDKHEGRFRGVQDDISRKGMYEHDVRQDTALSEFICA